MLPYLQNYDNCCVFRIYEYAGSNSMELGLALQYIVQTPYCTTHRGRRPAMQDARTQEDGRTAARRQQLNTMNNNPMRCGRRRFRSGDHRILHPFCPADSMYEVRGYESRSRCQAEEQEKIRAATTTEEEQELMLRSS